MDAGESDGVQPAGLRLAYPWPIRAGAVAFPLLVGAVFLLAEPTEPKPGEPVMPGWVMLVPTSLLAVALWLILRVAVDVRGGVVTVTESLGRQRIPCHHVAVVEVSPDAWDWQRVLGISAPPVGTPDALHAGRGTVVIRCYDRRRTRVTALSWPPRIVRAPVPLGWIGPVGSFDDLLARRDELEAAIRAHAAARRAV